MDPQMDEDLSDLYYNLENESAYAGINKLYRAAKMRKLPYTRREIIKWLNAQDVYTLHFPVKKSVKRSKIISWGPNWLLEGDMAILPDFRWRTSNKPWLLVCVDTFTKMLYVKALSSKKGPETAEALREIFSAVRPVYFQTDYGAEFFNKDVDKVLKEFDVHHYGAGTIVKAAHAERAIRTLKNKIYKHFTKNPKRGEFEEDLQKIVDGLNHTVHSSHKLRLVDVSIENQDVVFARLYLDHNSKVMKPIYKKGDKVRLSKLRSPFQKGFRQNYTKEIFEITDVILTRSPPMYKIKSIKDNVPISGSMYAEEMVKVEENSSK